MNDIINSSIQVNHSQQVHIKEGMSILDNHSQLALSSSCRTQATKSVLFNIGRKIIKNEKTNNIFHEYQADENMKLSVSKLTDTQIRQSQIYNNLVQKIDEMTEMQAQSKQQHNNRMKQLDNLIVQNKETTHAYKFNVWQLRNQIMGLQEQLADQMQQNHEIDQWLNNQQQQQQQQIQSQQYDQQAAEQQDQQQGGDQNQDFQDIQQNIYEDNKQLNIYNLLREDQRKLQKQLILARLRQQLDQNKFNIHDGYKYDQNNQNKLKYGQSQQFESKQDISSCQRQSQNQYLQKSVKYVQNKQGGQLFKDNHIQMQVQV